MMGSVLSHIPCCGPQVLMAGAGIKLLGAYSTTVLYQLQFIIPIIMSILATLLFVYLAHRHRHHVEDCAHRKHLRARDIGRFFVIDLVIGYIIVSILFLSLPPHDHRVMTGQATGWITVEDQMLAVEFSDRQRLWPWSHRHFIAHLNNVLDEDAESQTMAAKEITWYRAAWGDAAKYFGGQARTVPVRYYSRMNPKILLDRLSGQPFAGNQPAVKFYLVADKKDLR